MAKVDWEQDSYETSKPMEVMPKGRYLCTVVATDTKPTKRKDGKFIEVEFAVMRPAEFKGRKLWARLNVHNPSEMAQRIGREQFNSLADAVGLLHKVDKTERLHDKTLVLLVAVAEGTKGPMNEVIGFMKHEGGGTAGKKDDPAPAASAKKKDEPKAETGKASGGGGAKFDDLDDDIPF